MLHHEDNASLTTLNEEDGIAAALAALNLGVLTTSTWPLAMRQALEAHGKSVAAACTASPEGAASAKARAEALCVYVQRLQREEPAEQSAARAAWADAAAVLASQGA